MKVLNVIAEIMISYYSWDFFFFLHILIKTLIRNKSFKSKIF